MKSNEYKYLEDTLSGRRQRDPAFEAQLSDVADPRATERQRLIDSKTVEEREIEQRRYSLDTYGREHMKRYARAIVSEKPLGELAVEGDQVRSDAPQIHEHKSAPPQLKGHCGGEKPGPWCDKNGKLLLQNHAACPQRQVLQLI